MLVDACEGVENVYNYNSSCMDFRRLLFLFTVQRERITTFKAFSMIYCFAYLMNIG